VITGTVLGIGSSSWIRKFVIFDEIFVVTHSLIPILQSNKEIEKALYFRCLNSSSSTTYFISTDLNSGNSFVND